MEFINTVIFSSVSGIDIEKLLRNGCAFADWDDFAIVPGKFSLAVRCLLILCIPWLFDAIKLNGITKAK